MSQLDVLDLMVSDPDIWDEVAGVRAGNVRRRGGASFFRRRVLRGDAQPRGERVGGGGSAREVHDRVDIGVRCSEGLVGGGPDALSRARVSFCATGWSKEAGEESTPCKAPFSSERIPTHLPARVESSRDDVFIAEIDVTGVISPPIREGRAVPRAAAERRTRGRPRVANARVACTSRGSPNSRPEWRYRGHVFGRLNGRPGGSEAVRPRRVAHVHHEGQAGKDAGVWRADRPSPT